MFQTMQKKKKSTTFRSGAFLIIAAFFINFIIPAHVSYAQVLGLPNAGTMVSISSGFTPALIGGIKIYPKNPLIFDFVINKGDSKLENEALKQESEKLIRYFLSSLTVPENELWVNLSPHENNKIIPKDLGQTEMGRDMLAQDYLLKQLTASLIYPEDELGKIFWDKIYKTAYEKYGTTNIPVNTFNKVWIMPKKIVVYEKGDRAFVIESQLKVMLEEDYLALKNSNNKSFGSRGMEGSLSTTTDKEDVNDFSSNIVREIIIPALEKEVNEGKNFAQLRQIYNSIILAHWFKNNLKNSVLNRVYSDQNKIRGIEIQDKEIAQKIYDQYIDAFKKGVCDFVKVEYDAYERKNIPRKYFSGGVQMFASNISKVQTSASPIAATKELDRHALEEKLFNVTATVVPSTNIQNTQFGQINNKIVGEFDPGDTLHIDSHQALAGSFNLKGKQGAFATVFGRLHDIGKSKSFRKNMEAEKNNLINTWTTLARIQGNNENVSQKLAQQAYNFLINNKANYMISVVVSHGTTGIHLAQRELEKTGMPSQEALGYAILFAAHHPGFPITLVDQFVVPGLIPEELKPIFLINDQNGNPNSLRLKLADYAANLLGIDKSEARMMALTGFALDRVTPARRMTHFELNKDGSIVWTGGETAKKYPLIVTNISQENYEEFNINVINEKATKNFKDEASKAIEAVDFFIENTTDKAKIKELEEFKILIQSRSSIEIEKTVTIQNAAMDIATKINNFSGHLSNIKNDIARVTEKYKTLVQEGRSEQDIDAAGYLLGQLITLNTNPISTDTFKKVQDIHNAKLQVVKKTETETLKASSSINANELRKSLETVLEAGLAMLDMQHMGMGIENDFNRAIKTLEKNAKAKKVLNEILNKEGSTIKELSNSNFMMDDMRFQVLNQIIVEYFLPAGINAGIDRIVLEKLANLAILTDSDKEVHRLEQTIAKLETNLSGDVALLRELESSSLEKETKNLSADMKGPMKEITKLKAELKEMQNERRKQLLNEGSSKTSASSAIENVGGIDFNAENFNIETRGSGIDFVLPEFSDIELEGITGFTPVIIHIAPATNVFQLLGLNDEDGPKGAS